MTTNTVRILDIEPPKAAGYINAIRSSAGHAITLILRRRRFAMAAIITLLPILIPVLLAMFSKNTFADAGNELFVRLVEQLYISVLTPLLALFFASMLVAEDIEMQTIAYILTRPIPRSAWVLGRFLAYLLMASVVFLVSMGLTFVACTILSKISLTNPRDLELLAHYAAVGVAALAAYGSLAVFLGAFTRRPIVYGVLLLYGWEKIANMIPGVVDFLTIRKYIKALLPVLATQRNVEEVQTALINFQKQVFAVSATYAGVVLVLVTISFLAASIWVVRKKEFGSRAVGS